MITEEAKTEENTGSEDTGSEEFSGDVNDMTTDQKREYLQSIQTGHDDEQEDDGSYDLDDDSGDASNEAESAEQRIARLEHENREMQLKFDRQGNELGERRKALKELEEQLEQSIADDQENGFNRIAQEGFGAIEEHQNRKAQLDQIRREQQQLDYQESSQQTRNIIKSRLGDDAEDLIEDVRNALIEDGVPETQARSIDPYSLKKDVLYNLMQRAKLNRELSSLREENDALRNGQTNFLSKIDRTARNGRINGRSGKSSSEQSGELTMEKISSMSLDEKRKYLAKLKKLNS